MLKEVGASGQISLGKKYAGRLFQVIVHPNDHFELVPMQAVPLSRSAEFQPGKPADGWLPPGGYQATSQWALDNRQALEAYAERIANQGTAAEQLQAFLAIQNDDASH